jgi:hypothetical protein
LGGDGGEEISELPSGENMLLFSWGFWSFEIGGKDIFSSGEVIGSGKGCSRPAIYKDDSFWELMFEEMFRESLFLVRDSLCWVGTSLSVDMSGTTTFFLAFAMSALIVGVFPKKIGEVTFSILLATKMKLIL